MLLPQREIPRLCSGKYLNVVDAAVPPFEQLPHHLIDGRELRSLQRADSTIGIVLKHCDDLVAALAHALEQTRRRGLRQLNENQIEVSVERIVDGGVGAGGAGKYLELPAQLQHDPADGQMPLADMPERREQRNPGTAPLPALHQRLSAGGVAGEDSLRLEQVDRLPRREVTDPHILGQPAEVRQLIARILPVPDACSENLADFLILRHRCNLRSLHIP